MVLFLIYIIIIILGGSINIGPLSLRVIATSLMILYLFITIKRRSKLQPISYSYIWIYLLFSIIMGITLLINGEFIEFEFTKKFLAYNLVSVVAFLAVDRFITSEKRLIILIVSLLSIILVNDIITYLQFVGNPVGWIIGYLFGDIDKSLGKIGDRESLMGVSATPGIFGEVVKSAYYIAVITPLCFCLFSKRNSPIIKIFGFIVLICSIIAVFMSQQRAAFAVVILTLLFYLFNIFRKYPFTIICLLSILLISSCLFISNDPNIELGRMADASDNLREKLIIKGISFIEDHPLLGGPISFLKQTSLPAHNLILDSYIYSGLFGFIIMMILFAKTTWQSTSMIITGMSRKNSSLLIAFTAISVINCMIYSCLHTTSYLSGEVIIFILLAIMLKTSLFFTNHKRILTQSISI